MRNNSQKVSVVRKQTGYLMLYAQLRKIETDIRSKMRDIFKDVPPDAPLNIQPFKGSSSHIMAVIEAGNNPLHRLLVKGKKKHDRVWQSLDTEHEILQIVAPEIYKKSPSARCPRVVAYYSDEDILIMEMIEGGTLYSELFGLGRSSVMADSSELVGLCGEWLGLLHTLTSSGKDGNPFEWLVKLFDDPFNCDIIEKYGSMRIYREIKYFLDEFSERYSDFKRSFCTIHSDFAPYNILVKDGNIYVVDLASCKEGYPYADISFYTMFYEILLPWRRIAGTFRMDMKKQKQSFLDKYFSIVKPLDEPEIAIMCFARLQAMTALTGRLEMKCNLKWAVYSRVVRPWVKYRFRLVCQEELQNLSRLAEKLL